MPIDYDAAPPVKRGRPAGSKNAPKPPVVNPKITGYASTLEDLRDLLVTGAMVAGWDADAGALQYHTPEAIPVYAELAAEIEPFGKFLDGFNQVGGKWLKLAMVTLPLALQLAANHGIVKPAIGGMFNTQPPELLRAEILTQKLAIQQAAQESLKAAQAQAEEMMSQAQAPAA